MYPNAFYRVSVKALIKNEAGEILVVKENQDTWSLPGGGLDHGESPKSGILREIKEELGVQPATVNAIIGTESFQLPARQAWLMWVVYDVTLHDNVFILGDGVTAARFIDPQMLRGSNDIFEQTVYKIAGAVSAAL